MCFGDDVVTVHLPGSVYNAVRLESEDATRQACAAFFKYEMDLAIQHLTCATWAAANEIAWLGFRDLGQEILPAFPHRSLRVSSI